ncbi:MAG: hypothetical protein ABIG68_05540, partial [Acidobacteriota bacterium]
MTKEIQWIGRAGVTICTIGAFLLPPVAPAQAPASGGARGPEAPQASSEISASQFSKAGTFTAARGSVEKKLFITGELQAEKSIQVSVPRIRSAFASTVTFLA